MLQCLVDQAVDTGRLQNLVVQTFLHRQSQESNMAEHGRAAPLEIIRMLRRFILNILNKNFSCRDG